MLNFFKRKIREVYSPVDGEVVELSSVNDEVFSALLVGDGIAIKPMSNTFCSPIDGVVTQIFHTNHAFTITNEKDLSIMVHIGLDTVSLNGEGFSRVVEEGAHVSVGDAIIEADLELIKQNGKDTITPIIVTEDSNVKEIEKLLTIAKQGDKILEVK